MLGNASLSSPEATAIKRKQAVHLSSPKISVLGKNICLILLLLFGF